MAPAAQFPWATWLPRQPWFAGAGRTISTARPAVVVPLRDGAAIELLDVGYGDGSTERYQVITPVGDTGTARLLLRLIDEDAVIGEARFSREPGATLPAGAAVRVIDTEQSNTSVVFDGRAVLKLFRRVSAGINPDAELTGALSRAGNPHVAPLLGGYRITAGGETVMLGTLSGYAPESVDGWTLAGRGDLGEGDARSIGEALASVHADLARVFGTATAEVPVEAMAQRLRAAVAAVPGLAGYTERIERRYAAVAGVPFTVQRIHGDLHLGQVLRTPRNWLLIDFEGEPDRPLGQRRRPDSVLRDVAGMLRSFSYAGCAAGIGAAFRDGYAAACGTDPAARPEVLAAYELDRAVYEAAYEARHRPARLHIPMAWIATLFG